MALSKPPRLGLEERYPGLYTLLDVISLTLEDLILFCARRPPIVNSLVNKFNAPRPCPYPLNAYLRRFTEHSGASNECFVLMLIYIDRLITNNLVSLNHMNVHRLITSGMLLAAKYFDDNFYFNPVYDNVGGITKGEVNDLEVEFLKMMDFRLHVPRDQYEQFYQYLIQTALNRNLVTCHLFMPKPLGISAPVEAYVEEEAENFMLVPIQIAPTKYTLQYHVDFELDENIQRQLLDERKQLAQVLQQQKQQNVPLQQQLVIQQQQQQLFQAQAQLQIQLKLGKQNRTSRNFIEPPPGFGFEPETLCYEFSSKCQVVSNNNTRIPNQLDYLTRAHTEPNNFELNRLITSQQQQQAQQGLIGLNKKTWMTHSMNSIPVNNVNSQCSTLNPNASAYCFLGQEGNATSGLERKLTYSGLPTDSTFNNHNVNKAGNVNCGWNTSFDIDAEFFKAPRASRNNFKQYF